MLTTTQKTTEVNYMNIGKKIVLSMTAATVLLGTVLTSVVPARADVPDPSHQHEYSVEKYLRSEEDNIYTHRVQIGKDHNGFPVYGSCVVIVETEYYTWKCKYCNDTHGGVHTKKVEDHSYCK